LKIGWN